MSYEMMRYEMMPCTEYCRKMHMCDIQGTFG